MTKPRPLNERIESAKTEIKQRESRLKALLQKQKTKERKERTHRLCQRGGFLECILPDTIPLSLEQFRGFLEKTLLTDYAQRKLREMQAQNSTPSTLSANGDPAKPHDGIPAPKPANTNPGGAMPETARTTKSSL